MKKNDILKAFVNEEGSLMFIIKKNDFKYYLSIVLVVLSVMMSLRSLYAFENFNIEKDQTQFWIWISVTFFLPCLLYFEYYKSQKEQFLILGVSSYLKTTSPSFYFYLKKANRTKSKYLDLRKFEIVSISLKEDDEIILLSDKELPWGNRKIVISDEFKDRKEEVLEFLKLIFLNK